MLLLLMAKKSIGFHKNCNPPPASIFAQFCGYKYIQEPTFALSELFSQSTREPNGSEKKKVADYPDQTLFMHCL